MGEPFLNPFIDGDFDLVRDRELLICDNERFSTGDGERDASLPFNRDPDLLRDFRFGLTEGDRDRA